MVELFPLNIHSTLLSPWTSASLCWSSLISSPRCLFRSWESRSSCARLAWKCQHIMEYNQKHGSGSMWGFVGLLRPAPRPSGAMQSPLDKCIHDRKCTHHTMTTAWWGQTALAVNLSTGISFVSRRAQGQGTEGSVIFDFLEKKC